MMTFFTDFLEYDFLLYALLGTFFLSLTCGIISPLIIARKNAFMGAAISHSTLLGLAISLSLFEIAQALPIFISTLLITLFLTFFLAYSTYRQKLPNDSLIGIFYTSTMAIGIIIHSLFSKNQSDLLSFLFGNILLLTKEDLYLTIFIFITAFVAIIIPLKKWLFITYDEEGAITSGIKASRYHYFFFLILALLIVTSIKLAGTILVETLLLVPGFFALRFAKSTRQTFVLSTIFSCLMSILGIFLANALSLPSGATLAAVLFTGLLLSFLLKFVYHKMIK